jgi:hypothetical protein
MDFVSLGSVWIPLVLSAVFVFIVSSIIHMALPYHKNDYRKLPDEDRILDAIRNANAAPGAYFFPFHSMKDMKSPEMQEKFKRGPLGMMHIRRAGAPNMGKFLGVWFIYLLVISLFVAYLTSRTRPAGAEYWEIFRVAGATAFLAYAGAQIQNSIWRAEPWGNTWKHVLDGLIYAVVTGATFGWLWPK